MAPRKPASAAAGTKADFGAAFALAREETGLRKRALAPRLGVSVRTLVRWELGDVMPREYAHEALIEWLRSLPEGRGDRALRALGVLLPPAPKPVAASVAALSREDARAAKQALDHALLTAAEQHEVPARAARRLVTAVLDAIDAQGLAVKVARELVAAAKGA